MSFKEFMTDYGWAIVALVIVVGVVWWLVLSMPDGTEECRQDCKSYGYAFVEYEAPGYRNEECWCRDYKENKPVRVR